MSKNIISAERHTIYKLEHAVTFKAVRNSSDKVTITNEAIPSPTESYVVPVTNPETLPSLNTSIQFIILNA